MFIYVYLGPVFLIASSVFSLVQIETKHASSSIHYPSFINNTVIEVISNISRVNNALQELINNYEKLKKINTIKSFESADDYSTDSEIDERYRNEKSKKKIRAKATTKNLQNGFPATQLIAFDTVESSATDGDSVKETKSEGFAHDITNQNRLPRIENWLAQRSPNKNEIKSNDTAVSEEMGIEEKFSMTTPKKSQIFFIDTHKQLNNNISKSNGLQANVQSIRSQKYYTPEEKTRYKKADHKSDLRSSFYNGISLSINIMRMPKTSVNNKEVHKALPRETWNHINRNKINKIQDDAFSRTKQYKENINIGGYTRIERNSLGNGGKDSETPVFHKTAARIGHQDSKNKDSYSYNDTAAEEKEMNKEIFKTSVLRKAYGDSCTKLVVRKCFKGCKMALKRACASSSCKKSFKESFKLHSRTGCIMQFGNSQADTKRSVQPLRRSNSIIDKISTYSRNLYESIPAGGVNFTSDDDLSAACWSLLRTEKFNLPKSKLNSPLEPIEDKQTYMLRARRRRDRYEKACQAASAGKCKKISAALPIKANVGPILSQNQSIAQSSAERRLLVLRTKLEKTCDRCSRRRCRRACLYAYEQTCSIFHCAPRRKTTLQERCRRECSRAFKARSSEETSSSSSSSSSDSITLSSDSH